MPPGGHWMTIRDNVTTEIEKFWSRFGTQPGFAGKRILEVGCGRGDLSIGMAAAGAESVVGVDILSEHVAEANDRVRSEHADLAGRVEFTTQTLAELDSEPFDLVVSKDSFEHIIDVPAMLAAIRGCLAPSGVVYIGFSPLYHSPYGDHDRRKTAFRAWGIGGRALAMLPWGHLFLEKKIIQRHDELNERRIASMHDLNLNMMSIAEFRSHVRAAGFQPRYFATNRGSNPLGWPFSVLRRIPGLEKFCTYNVYCELKIASADSESS